MIGPSFVFVALFLPGILAEDSSYLANLKCKEQFGYHRDPKNCSNFYQCSYGKPAGFQYCPPELVFSNAIKNCVPKYSQYDDCIGGLKMFKPTQTIEARCKAGEKLIHHPKLCSAYYNCSNTNSILRNYLEECPYPMLFSLRTFACEPFENVQCGDRKEPKYACDYIKYGCPFAHCQPCRLRIAKCNDEDQYAQVQPWSPEYTHCYKGRTMNTEVCKKGLIFDPIRKRCVDDINVKISDEDIPCTREGYTPDLTDCTKFYFCNVRFISLTIQCEKGNVYNPKTGSCNSPKDVCRPCGTKIC